MLSRTRVDRGEAVIDFIIHHRSMACTHEARAVMDSWRDSIVFMA